MKIYRQYKDGNSPIEEIELSEAVERLERQGFIKVEEFFRETDGFIKTAFAYYAKDRADLERDSNPYPKQENA